MHTVIQSTDFALTNALENFIRRQVARAMKTSSDRIESLIIRLKDVNGPKGGMDKQCSVEVKLANLPVIVVSKCDSNAYSSIRHAITRASRITLRRLGKRQAKMRASRSSDQLYKIVDPEVHELSHQTSHQDQF